MKYIIRKKSPGPGGHNEYMTNQVIDPLWTRIRSLALKFDTKEAAENIAMQFVVKTPRYIGRLSVDEAPEKK